MELKFTNAERKNIKNTGNLPGFENGFANQKQSGYPIYKEHVSPWEMWKESLNGKSFIGSNLDKKIQQDSGYVSDDPYVKNPNLEPKVDKQLKTGNMQNAISGIPGLAAIYDSFKDYQTEDELLAEFRPTSVINGGIQHQKLVRAKNGKLPGYSLGNVATATASGAMAGSAFGGVGAIVGGAAGLLGSIGGEIFSSAKQKENELKTLNKVGNINKSSEGEALTTSWRIANSMYYGNQYDQPLRGGFACGKLPKYDLGKVATVFGEMYGEPNAKVSNGEVIAREVAPGQFSAYRVPGMKNNKDGKLALLGANDYVISNKNGSSDIAAAGNIKGAINHMIDTGNPSYKCGKLPKHAEGWLGNAIPATFGTLAGLGQYIDAKNSRIYRPSTYVSNPYELNALTTLAGLSVNPYPIVSQLRNAEARTNRAIDIAGGLSGGQRTAARLAALNSTQGNISKLLGDIQQQNNAYRSSYAQAAINAGQASRQARMQANQWDLDMYAKAHAARNRGIQTGIANMLAQIQQYQANEFKRRQFNETMDLYRADQKQRRDQFDWYSKYYNKSLPFQLLGDNQYGDPITDEDMIYGNPFAPRALRKRRGEIQ